MIRRVIEWSLANRFLVVVGALLLLGWGIFAMLRTPLDAIPDLSDVQVIIKTEYPGQAPQVVEDQVTYPLTTTMLSVPNTKAVRGYSFFGDSFINVVFEDGTDMYWARSRVLEYLNEAASELPEGVQPSLGPDATSVGWVYQYALVDRSGEHSLADLRSLQDWFLEYELQTVEGVSEVAAVGGMVRQYQVVADPEKLLALDIPLSKVKSALQRGNQEAGGSVIEMAEAEYMVRATGYIDGLDDLRSIPLGVDEDGTPIHVRDVAEVRHGPELRRGVAELNGNGEVAGGIVVMRHGENALATIDRVKDRLDQLKEGLPEGVEIVTTYDRSGLILDAVDTLQERLIEELIIVALVALIFLFHLRSTLVAVVALPLGILGSFVVMYYQGINANIMSLGGIALAIGTMVDGAMVMIENAHKQLERDPDADRWEVVRRASTEVGPALFFSLAIIALSFVPVFALEAQEGRMFAPLAFTKTYAMAFAAGLSITLVPVLMGYFIRGRIRKETANPVNRAVAGLYRPVLGSALGWPKTTVALAALVLASTYYPYSKLGSEFMPPLWEGDLLYMPTTDPGISIGKARQLLQQTDKIIQSFPEVETTFGKVGRADTATDPAPLTMIETTITLKPRSEWREGMTVEKLKRELDEAIDFPGLSDAWTMPIKTRIDMLATGIKTPVGIKVAGPDLEGIQELAGEIEEVVAEVPGTASAYAERSASGRYVIVEPDRELAARYGLNVADVQEVVQSAVGGMEVTESVEGRERYPVNLRYPREYRDSLEELRQVRVATPTGAQVPLTQVADIRVEDGPPMIKSDNARLNGYIYIDLAGVDVGTYVERAKQAVAEQVDIPAGYSLTWSGQYEYMERAMAKLQLLVPLTLVIIALLLYLNFRRLTEVAVVLGTVPFALVGGFWLFYLLGYDLSIAAGVGFIALAGVAVEIGVVMLVYLNLAVERYRQEGRLEEEGGLREAIMDGALRRIRPIAMTVLATTLGLLPIMIGHGTGSQVMKRIAGPMVGGMVTTTILTLIVIPVVYRWVQGRYMRRE
ncbi:cation transporter [Thiohalorhabdus denitrificans]|uniref:Cu(I)/Ag(I) efflux system membrane protein CusA/SilA n=1 Tax=Thiohalorhabdus denitrificans TaxID=381306 RepID=A0A0P9CKE5_9GAMM|nr:efflux RND transporter permease subunit [Thiohalorhabdus denitrificans]KPV39411.1 cation transporter [Thiohalorhabdus denitrificans]SCY04148.1 Cu(I)/Ag(I) efflux system membrane protein CusA/SilA [Thiohalorhabdus denitrificans]